MFGRARGAESNKQDALLSPKMQKSAAAEGVPIFLAFPLGNHQQDRQRKGGYLPLSSSPW